MFTSHLGEEPGVPTFSQQVSDGIIRGLSTPPQALPTNGTEALATPNNTPVPTNPASPLSYNSIQPLAVLASRTMVQAPVPAAPGMSTATKIGIGAVVAIGLLAIMKMRR